MKLVVASIVTFALSAGLATAQKAPAFGPAPGSSTQPNGTAVAALPTITHAQERSLVDLNSAIWERLMDLPGVDRALAQKIIDNRPYASKKDLKDKQIVPDATYKKIQRYVEAKETKEMKAARQAKEAQEKADKAKK